MKALFARPSHQQHITAHAKLIAQTERELRQAVNHPCNQGVSIERVASIGLGMYAESAFVYSRRGNAKLAGEMGIAASHVAFEYLGAERE